jgi:hypothetical protein
VIKEVKCFALTKKFLLKEIFPKYPDIASSIKAEALLRYKRNIHTPIVILNISNQQYNDLFYRLNTERRKSLSLTRKEHTITFYLMKKRK